MRCHPRDVGTGIRGLSAIERISARFIAAVQKARAVESEVEKLGSAPILPDEHAEM